MTVEEIIVKKLHKLPADKQCEVLELVELLTEERGPKATPTLRQNWAGSLREYGDKYTALELEKTSLEWRWDNADQVVKWNTESIVSAIRELT